MEIEYVDGIQSSSTGSQILSIIIPWRIAVAFATVASNPRMAFLEVVPSHDILEKAQEKNISVILLQCCLHSFLL